MNNDGLRENEATMKTVWTLYDFEPREHDDLGFREGEILEILEAQGNDCKTDDWLLARSKKNGKVGYIPKNYVIDDDVDDVRGVASSGVCSVDATLQSRFNSTQARQTVLINCSKAKIVRALYDYEKQHENDLGFREGERFKVLDSTESSETSEWLSALHLRSGESGYVPQNYVVVEDSVDSQEWWFDVDRFEAEKLLMMPKNARGTFLIRNSREGTELVLSVLDAKKPSGESAVKHYRIRQDADSGSVYVSQKRFFQDIYDLVTYYMKTKDELCCVLTDVCPQVPNSAASRDTQGNQVGTTHSYK